MPPSKKRGESCIIPAVNMERVLLGAHNGAKDLLFHSEADARPVLLQAQNLIAVESKVEVSHKTTKASAV